ncbi:hypothetical protein HY620_00375 [Candidatus Uhrbacteria bacterium]|nr:hypothetical protein [Candidatus Uhrbacteria bacterium]
MIHIGEKTRYFIAFVLFFGLAAGMLIMPVARAQEVSPSLATDIQHLEEELKSIEAQIAQYQKELSKAQGERGKLSSLITLLKVRQADIAKKIQASTESLEGIRQSLEITKKDIEDQIALVESMKERIGELLRLLQQTENESFLRGFIIHDNIFSFLEASEQQQDLLGALDEKLQTLKKIVADLEQKKKLFESEEEALVHLLDKQALQQERLDHDVQHNSVKLAQARAREKKTAAEIAASRARAANIRSRMYELFNVGKQISFGEAYNIARWVSDMVGVRPALLLAVLTQESNLGRNVGTCNRLGDPVEKQWRAIMKPTRDHGPFLTITKELGLDPDTTPVSCPMRQNGKQIGWGGAMGPAQFIPSTWMGYRGKVQAITGKAANPWDIRDAFIAASVKLHADGADGAGNNEFAAAMKYFAGSVNLAYRFYGDTVLAIAARYQKDIDDLESADE